MCEPIIEVKNMTKIYGNSYVLNRLSFSVQKGSLVAVIGESGSGKTTLLNILYGFTDFDEGSYTLSDVVRPRPKRTCVHECPEGYTLNGQALPQNGRSSHIQLKNLSLNEKQKFRHAFMGYIPQDYGLIEEWTVYDNITLPLLFDKNAFTRKTPLHLKNLFTRMHLDYPTYIYRKAASLSGGEKQRIAIIRALITNPRLLIADELTSALDYSMKTSILSLLQELKRTGITIIFSTHDSSLLEHCDQIIDLMKYNLN